MLFGERHSVLNVKLGKVLVCSQSGDVSVVAAVWSTA
jgi:hypothetical protein